jgi:hypothetical protein
MSNGQLNLICSDQASRPSALLPYDDAMNIEYRERETYLSIGARIAIPPERLNAGNGGTRLLNG